MLEDLWITSRRLSPRGEEVFDGIISIPIIVYQLALQWQDVISSRTQDAAGLPRYNQGCRQESEVCNG